MLESEFLKWHNKQIKREDALKEVESKVKQYSNKILASYVYSLQAFQELRKCWDKWMKTRDKLIIISVVTLRTCMIKQGMTILDGYLSSESCKATLPPPLKVQEWLFGVGVKLGLNCGLD